MHEKWLRIVTVLSHLLFVGERGRKLYGAWDSGKSNWFWGERLVGSEMYIVYMRLIMVAFVCYNKEKLTVYGERYVI